MKSANEMYGTAYRNGIDKLVAENIELLDSIERALEDAATRGQTEIYDVFINHKVKHKVVDYLKDHGYQCFEAKLGNTFTISCDPTFKK